MRRVLCRDCERPRRRLAKWTAARDALKKGSEHAERERGAELQRERCSAWRGPGRRSLGNSEEAAVILRRAVGLFEAAGQTFLISRTLAQLANILADYDPAESLRQLESPLL